MPLKSLSILALRALVLGSAVLGAAVLVAAPASAAIKCSGGYQVVNGALLATPYCQDQQVAQVARASGIRVTDSEIRNNPNTKRDVCRTIGRDNRVYLSCLESNPNGRRF
jgi:hypothetical protein